MDDLSDSRINQQRILNVQNCFGSSGIPLMKKGRVLVGEGVLTKLCRKKPKQRQFFLFNDLLIYGTVVVSGKIYNKQHVLEMATIHVRF